MILPFLPVVGVVDPFNCILKRLEGSKSAAEALGIVSDIKLPAVLWSVRRTVDPTSIVPLSLIKSPNNERLRSYESASAGRSPP